MPFYNYSIPSKLPIKSKLICSSFQLEKSKIDSNYSKIIPELRSEKLDSISVRFHSINSTLVVIEIEVTQ